MLLQESPDNFVNDSLKIFLPFFFSSLRESKVDFLSGKHHSIVCCSSKGSSFERNCQMVENLFFDFCLPSFKALPRTEQLSGN